MEKRSCEHESLHERQKWQKAMLNRVGLLNKLVREATSICERCTNFEPTLFRTTEVFERSSTFDLNVAP